MADSIDFNYKPLPFDDTTWYAKREVGHPDDPYNKNCKKLPKDGELYSEYIKIGRELCDQLEKDILTNEDDGWEFMQDSNGVVTHRKVNEGSSILTFKGCTVIQSTPEIIRLWLIQMDQRKYWDPTFYSGSYELEAEVYARLAYNVYSAPWPVTYRDFALVASEAIRDDGLFLAGVHSVEHPDYPPTEYVRGTIYSSGFVIKPLPPTEDGLHQCRVWYTGTVDIAGWVPVSVANLVNSAQPMNLATLRDMIVFVGDLLLNVFKDLFALSESQFKAGEIERIFSSRLEEFGYSDRPDILYDAFKNYFLKQRVGPSDQDLIDRMEKEGKRKTMHMLFQSFYNLILSLKGGKELFSIARNYFEGN